MLDKLLDWDGEEDPTKLTRFANYLRSVLPSNDPLITEAASKALGRLALPGGALTSEFVEFEVKKAFEWLQGGPSLLQRLLFQHIDVMTSIRRTK